jgi:ribosomal-protein-alanine N-acetyltransferase
MEFEIIHTSNLRLRKISPLVHDYVFKNYSDAELKHFFGILTESELSSAKEKYNKGYITFNKSFLYFQLLDKTGEVFGSIGYHTWYLDHRRAEIFYLLNTDEHKGQGIMSEAIRTVLKYGFEEMNLHRVEAFIGPANIPSAKLVLKCGFVKEGYLREHYIKNEVLQDSLVFSLLRTEFRKES